MTFHLSLGPESGTVQAHDRTKQAKLHPADNQLFKIIGFNIAGMESADVAVPPGNTAHCHRKSRFHTHAKRLKFRRYIAVPHQRAELLNARICRSRQQNDFFFALFFQAVVKKFVIIIRIQHRRLRAVSRIQFQIGILLRMHFRLRLIQPEICKSHIVIILFDFIPYKRPGFRMRYVDKGLLTIEVKRSVLTVFRPNQQIPLVHLFPVLAFGIDSRPDRHYRLDSHLFQFPAHSFRVRPVFRVKFPFSLLRPMEKVYHNDRKRNPSFAVLSGCPKHFILTLVAQLTLPESCRPFRKSRRISGQFTVLLQNLCRRFSHIHKVICLISAVGYPHRMIFRCLTASGRRIIPEKSVPE